MPVTPGLDAFLRRIVDYAGMFPPASLSLEQAIRNDAEYRSGPDAWMLSRFICPAAKLAKLGAYVHLFSDSSPLTLSVLGRASYSADKFLAGLDKSLAHIVVFREAYGSRALVEMIELPLPPGRPPSDLFDRAAELIEARNLRHLMPFYEARPEGNWQRAVETTLDGIVAHNTRRAGAQGWLAGFKLRTGGVTANAFPTAEQIAFVIVACRKRGIALKFTAGLHHPVRRFDWSIQTKMHGFLNVFAAGILSHARRLSAADVQAILEEERAARFRFSDRGFSWNGLGATVDEIAAARRSAIVSFGSCDFDEPRDDLRALGLLERR